MDIVRRDQFLGANNRAKPERLPEGAVADAINFDFTVGGKAELRVGFEKIRSGKLRGIFEAGGFLYMVDDSHIIRYQDGVETVMGLAPDGPIAASEHNSALYLNTPTESVVVTDSVRPWKIEAPQFDVSLVDGNMKPGIYKIGVTRAEDGKESGCVPVIIEVSDGHAIRVVTQGGPSMRLYASVTNGQTLYYQGSAASINTISNPVDDTERLESAMLSTLPFCEILVSHKGLIVGSSGRFLYFTRPLMPHLHDPEQDYIQFSEPVTLLSSVSDGVYVCTANKTYFISGIGSTEMFQRQVLDLGAIRGTGVKLPNTGVAWFCRYGQVLAGPEGAAQLINAESYIPDVAEDGAAGIIEHNSNLTIATSMRGETQASTLKSRDYWDLEII